ncbi:DNA repair protein XRCC2 homolog [Anoplophora glabripennis]|uniref:DNA repair protein XRCC2 homolog n=1 Tax=Anoplophora glabripennis TaxID=217634 RepID=UPI000875940A|nr:DNA repair protein XRCC2 homolog [Anoplophora glabripennis]
MHCSKIESGVQLFSRVNRKSFLEDINSDLFPEGGPCPNQVIEITGDPKIDKNDLLIDFIVKCILPKKYNKEWKDSAAVLIITEFQISILKIIKVIETLLNKYNVTDSKKVVIQNALKNLIIFNCYSLEELEVTFYYVEKIIQCNENVNLVVIDNIAAHFWISSYNLSDTPTYYHHSLKMFEILYNVIKSLQVLLIFVRHERTTNRKKFNHRVDFRIEIERENQSYKAVVTNYDKHTVIQVPFHLKTILEFSPAINKSSS